tara:strand:+ start:4478 stop:5989 length:1512 start_codon:yes stop_codon:yes gene_type:complete
MGNNKEKNIKKNESTNFQTEYMIEKIKKIKKKKKNKEKENYKNIEEFSTLNNFSEKDEKDETNEKNERKNIKKDLLKSFENMKDVFPINLIHKFFFPSKEGFAKDDYEGYDTVDNKEVLGKNANLREMMIRFINYLYNSVNSYNKLIADGIINTLSKGDPTDKDYYLVHESVSWSTSTMLSSFMVYSWYFLMFYSKDQDYDLFNISRLTMLEQSSSEEHPEYTLYLFLFEFSILFIEKLNYILIDFIPSTINTILNGRGKFTLLFLGLIYYIKNSMKTLKDFLIKIIKGDSGFWINIMFGIVLLSFVISTISPTITGVVKVDIGTVMSTLSSILNPLGSILKVLFRFIFVLATNVPFAGIFVTLYLLIYSIGSLLIYNHKHEKGFDIFKEIDKHVVNNKSKYEKDDCTDNNGMFQEIIRIINVFIDIIYQRLLPIVLTIILFFSAFNFYNELSEVESVIPDLSLKTLLLFIIIMIIMILVPIIYSSSFSRLMKAVDPDFIVKK